MSAELSNFAIRRILEVLDGSRSHPYSRPARSAGEANKRWSAIHRLYVVIQPAPPSEYLRSAEFALTLKDFEAGAIFAHGQSLFFKDCPRLLVPKLVEVCVNSVTLLVRRV